LQSAGVVWLSAKLFFRKWLNHPLKFHLLKGLATLLRILKGGWTILRNIGVVRSPLKSSFKVVGPALNIRE
jgi:hypothetical protein